MRAKDQHYFVWLCEQIRTAQVEITDYNRLLSLLFDIEFTWVVSKDINRAVDGITLRREYEEAHFLDEICEGKPCSVLEMMVALATRCERDIMDDPDEGNRTGIWFWVMVENLGLLSQNDANFDQNFAKNRIISVLEQTSQNYDFFGTRLKKKVGHGTEIWDKMTKWLNENFIF